MGRVLETLRPYALSLTILTASLILAINSRLLMTPGLLNLSAGLPISEIGAD